MVKAANRKATDGAGRESGAWGSRKAKGGGGESRVAKTSSTSSAQPCVLEQRPIPPELSHGTGAHKLGRDYRLLRKLHLCVVASSHEPFVPQRLVGDE